MGWAYETAAGCSKTCSDGTPLFNELVSTQADGHIAQLGLCKSKKSWAHVTSSVLYSQAMCIMQHMAMLLHRAAAVISGRIHSHLSQS